MNQKNSLTKPAWKKELPSNLVLENFYRRLGINVATLLRPFKITANQVTALRIPLALIIFYLFSSTSKFSLLFVFIVLFKLLDKTDGALSRITNKVTQLSGLFDVIIDRLYWVLIFLGLTISVSKDGYGLTPWILLLGMLFGFILFQDFTFLDTTKQPEISWEVQSKKLKKKVRRLGLENKLFYQSIFTVYYLPDQIIAFALLLYYPAKVFLGLNSLLFVLVLYSLFFNSLFVYVVYSQFKTLLSKSNS